MLIGYLQHSGERCSTCQLLHLTRTSHSYVPFPERSYNRDTSPKPTMIFYPENRLYRRYMDKHPGVRSCHFIPVVPAHPTWQAKNEPVALGSHTPPMGRRYAWKVLALIQQGYRPGEAQRMVDQELQAYQAARHVFALPMHSILQPCTTGSPSGRQRWVPTRRL